MEDGHQPAGGKPRRDDGPEVVVRLPVEPQDPPRGGDPMPRPVPVDEIPASWQPASGEAATGETAEAVDPETSWETGPPRRFNVPRGWIALGVLVALGFAGWALARMLTGERHLDEESARVAARLDGLEEEESAARALLSEVETTVRAYLGADDIEEMLRHVRHPRRVRALMQGHYRRHPLEARGLDSISYMHPVTIESRPFLYVRALDTGGQSHSLVIEHHSDGSLRVDWESQVCYQPMSLGEFIAGKPPEAVDFRVYLRPDSYYAHEFTDPERYQSLYLTVRDSDEHLFGYVERGSGTDEELRRYLSRNHGKRQVPALVRLRFLPGTTSKRSVVVEKLLAPRWTYLDNPGP